MRAIKKVKKLIESSPSSVQGLIFARLIFGVGVRPRVSGQGSLQTQPR